jgi:flagellar hook-associated protein 1 FlgK
LEQSQDTLTRHLEVARQSVSGVSVDEEMANLVKGQHAYSAAARIITTVDEMLDTLVNRTLR